MNPVAELITHNALLQCRQTVRFAPRSSSRWCCVEFLLETGPKRLPGRIGITMLLLEPRNTRHKLVKITLLIIDILKE